MRPTLQCLALGFVYSVSTFKSTEVRRSGVPRFLNQSRQRQPFSEVFYYSKSGLLHLPRYEVQFEIKNILSALTANWKAIERVLLQCFHKYIVNIVHSGKLSTKYNFHTQPFMRLAQERWNDPEMNKKIIVYNFEAAHSPRQTHTQPGG